MTPRSRELLYQADPGDCAVVFDSNARDHALRNAAEFAEMLSGAGRGVSE